MDPRALARIERTNYLLSTAVIALGAVLLGRSYVVGLAAGSLIGAVNFSLIRRLVETWMRRPPKRRSATAFLFVPKMAALMAVVFAAVRYLPLSPTAFAIGFSIFLISIAIEAVRFTLGASGASEHPGEPVAK
jgi:hypothetical protein